MLTSWLEYIPNLKNTIEQHYDQGAFLMDVTSNPSAKDVYQKVIKTVEPLQKLPIKFYPQQPNQGHSLQDITLISTSLLKYTYIHVSI